MNALAVGMLSAPAILSEVNFFISLYPFKFSTLHGSSRKTISSFSNFFAKLIDTYVAQGFAADP